MKREIAAEKNKKKGMSKPGKEKKRKRSEEYEKQTPEMTRKKKIKTVKVATSSSSPLKIAKSLSASSRTDHQIVSGLVLIVNTKS